MALKLNLDLSLSHFVFTSEALVCSTKTLLVSRLEVTFIARKSISFKSV